MVAVSFVLVLALVSSTVIAQPGTDGFTEILARFKRQPTFEPPKLFAESVYEWIPPSEETPTPTSDEDPADIGLSYILQQLNIQPDEFIRRTNFTDRFGVTHLYGMPLHQGLLIENLHAAVHIKNGQIFFYSATKIVDDHTLTKRSPTNPESTVEISSEDAVKAAVDCLGVPFYNAIAPVKKSYKTGDGKILVWKFQLRDNPTTQWIEVKVDINTGVIVSKKDVKRKFTYTAIKLPNENPRGGFSKIAPGNLVAGAVNAFYVTNMVHDVFYAYGFNEPAGNFQRDNFGRGGIAGDPVTINLQDSKTENYVSFDTLPDGRSGVLNLHIFTTTNPNRDPALDNNAIIHELTHGLSGRLTGGAQTKMCMSKIESHGLSEGYSDVIALIFMAKPEDIRNTEKVIAEYVEGDSQGIRKYPYTTNMKVNPLKYQDAIGEKDPYHLGEIWATMLWEVYWNLVEAYGFSANLHDATQKQGNIIFLQLFVGTLMIQPCNPTFESAYDAMLVADAVYYGGIHEDLITKGFAKRGLGSIS
ncbi:hypothetical protein BSLG_010704 [Batrachochytrium salamandrivorans]|nr:hypothetical protein BSLG_010704 [Batrachochytrium salamandrivorans]